MAVFMTAFFLSSLYPISFYYLCITMQNKFLYFILIVLIVSSCKKDRPDAPIEREHTLLIYMLAENSLHQNASDDIDEIVVGMRQAPSTFRVYVYLDDYSAPRLYEINASGKQLIRSYEEANSASTIQLRAVLSYVKQKSPSKSYGMILWSHGYDWLPAPEGSRSILRTGGGIQPRYFGQDGNKWMDIADVDAALYPDELLYLSFDACYMAGIELTYRLRNKTHYILASPMEILGEGFPYHLMIPAWYGQNINLLPEQVLTSVASAYFEYYQNHVSTGDRYGAINLIRTTGLDLLAAACHPILSIHGSTVSNTLLQGTQYYERQHYPSLVYDLRAYLAQLGSSAQMLNVDRALAACVVYKNATAYLPFSLMPIRDYSGFGTYIPAPAMSYNVSYTKEPWYIATYLP